MANPSVANAAQRLPFRPKAPARQRRPVGTHGANPWASRGAKMTIEIGEARLANQSCTAALVDSKRTIPEQRHGAVHLWSAVRPDFRPQGEGNRSIQYGCRSSSRYGQSCRRTGPPQAGERIQEVAGNTKGSLDTSLRDQPMATLVAAAMVGFVLGALWKS
jgi:hypothetical protein